jgi:hypothetical protein
LLVTGVFWVAERIVAQEIGEVEVIGMEGVEEGRSGLVTQSSCGRGDAVLAVNSGGIHLRRI